MYKVPTGETLKEVPLGKRVNGPLNRYRHIPGKNWYNFGHVEEVPFATLFTDFSNSRHFPEIIARYDGILYYLSKYSLTDEYHSAGDIFEVSEEYLTYRKEYEKRRLLKSHNEQRKLFIEDNLSYYKEVINSSNYSVCGVELDSYGDFTYHYEGISIPLIKYIPVRVKTIHEGPVYLDTNNPQIEFSDYSSALHDAVKWVYKEIKKIHKQEGATAEQAFEAYKQCKK